MKSFVLVRRFWNMIGHEGPLRLREPKLFSAKHGFKFCFEPQLQILFR
jgi:hypothetical protein